MIVADAWEYFSAFSIPNCYKHLTAKWGADFITYVTVFKVHSNNWSAGDDRQNIFGKHLCSDVTQIILYIFTTSPHTLHETLTIYKTNLELLISYIGFCWKTFLYKFFHLIVNIYDVQITIHGLFISTYWWPYWSWHDSAQPCLFCKNTE